ncbi:hypothetical protein [Streptomyces sp. NBC_01565]|uniref:hypothetical protein n=1 Tax=unclassified Streptomyces TaxID=2593676 RepID=UPI002255305F|nr:hypothetical protein [Streptomyces sp. NBC_01565]MCX4539089.1 hypothetical protein [Streptomyces sp. NBC_01565]
MGTMVVGFRLGSDAKGRQATLVLTQAGVLHQSTRVLGMAPRPAKPHPPVAPDPHPVLRQAAELRKVYQVLTGRGYTRELIAPACVWKPTSIPCTTSRTVRTPRARTPNSSRTSPAPHPPAPARSRTP